MLDAERESVLKAARGWLDKGGFGLEHRVADLFAHAGFDVSRGLHYDDADDGEQRRREIDVVALRSKSVPVRHEPFGEFEVEASVGFYVECKHAPDRVCIVFTSERHSNPEPGRFVVASALGEFATYQLTRAGALRDLSLFSVPQRGGYSAVTF